MRAQGVNDASNRVHRDATRPHPRVNPAVLDYEIAGN